MRKAAVFLLCIATLLVIAECVTSCTTSWSVPQLNVGRPLITTYVCLELPASQLSDAHAAIELWEKSLRQWKHLEALDGPDGPQCAYYVHEHNGPVPEGLESSLAWASMIGGREIRMRVGRYERDTKGILMHEMGHALGAQHIPGTLMNATWRPNIFTCPDSSTVAQVAAWNHVSVGLLRWCY